MENDNDHSQEAERLRLLPRAEQRAIIAMYRDVAQAKGVSARDRKAGLERADALERLLKLRRKKG